MDGGGRGPGSEQRPLHAEFRVAEEVVASIAGLAAAQIEGVAGLGGGLGLGLGEVLGKRPAARGVRVEVGAREAAIDVYLLVAYGVRIPVVAQRVQDAVKAAVEAMTDLEVVEVNVHVQGLEPAGRPGGGGGSPPAEPGPAPPMV